MIYTQWGRCEKGFNMAYDEDCSGYGGWGVTKVIADIHPGPLLPVT